MKPPNDHLRGTGRTFRMLEYAIAQAQHGNRVTVCCKNRDSIRDHLDEVIKITKSSAQPIMAMNGITIPVGHGSIHFSVLPQEFDWRKMKIRGMPHNAIVLVDHAVIEDEFRLMTEMLYKFIEVKLAGIEKEGKK